MIQKLDDLALFGGAPTFDQPLHVGRPNIGDRAALQRRIDDILDRRWLTNRGPYLVEFEKRIAELTGVAHCVAVCNGTVALEIAIRALGMRDEVLVPSFTFVATAHALQWQEIEPRFCDVAPGTHNIDPESVESRFTDRTGGIIGVHVWGKPCEVERLEEIAAERGVPLLFDASHALGCSAGGRLVGGFGDAEVLSFHATKFVNTFEGGAILTNDDELAERMRLMKNFGFAGMDRVVHLGTNGKMNEISAAMGLTGLESLEDFVAANRCNYEAYREGLEGIPGLRFFRYDEAERNNYQYVILEIDEKRAGIDRDTLLEILHAERVLARRYFYPGCHRMEPYRSLQPGVGASLPRTEALVRRVMSLPTGTAVSTPEIGSICDLTRFVFEHRAAISARRREG